MAIEKNMDTWRSKRKKRKKIWTHEGPSKKEKKVGHMKVQEKNKKKKKR
jgi:hypothetical protein